MYLIPEDVADRQREYRPVVIRGVVKLQYLSYHMARHSFGTLTLTAGIPIESIARMMGHTNIDSTQVYAQVTDRKISSDMNRLMERRKPAAGKEAAG